MKALSFLATLAAISFVNGAQAGTYNIDTAHSNVGFSVTHLMISKVNGRFEKQESTFKFDEKSGQISDVAAKIDLDSVNTGEPKRDGHLKTADFFGTRNEKNELQAAKQFMTFKSKAVAKIDLVKKAPVKLAGELTLNGVSKPVTLEVTYRGSIKDPFNPAVTKVGFEAHAKINRKDFGLNWNKNLDGGGVIVGDEVAINLDGEAVPAQTTAAK
jgi:polyisoprenoid-binding protein YceI